MDRSELAPLIDHTVLGPETSIADVRRVLDEAREYGMNACIPPFALEAAADYAPDVTLATVIGFPHGQHSAAAKRREGVLAWKAGADELDVVINVGRLKAGEDDVVRAELAELTAAVPIPVKVIIETALLTDEEKHRACEAADAADAAMVKTSTGFADSVVSENQRANGDSAERSSADRSSGQRPREEAVSGGATVADVELMSDYLPVKASGGVGSYDEAMAMLEAGAERIGASSGVAILEGAPE
ncbi:deoxyribose-phosphate aldolase [Haloterrigena sp. SYSU A558-1]|uniref:Deoxyribose-phosphate aldolase n=1 Tax=Haloterrigena gelatinilytica TaxID=2741724 RepID=A0A8J8GIN3_9EURY|nr:deoxyribose-phosphate aldolase [Haloterrigena gelatinilytica]NUB90698.1 deoxyribose-phosphate aldolase [Haloterrigena gelatinilytica]NUC73484.1 deoxyribose-phosphate aldolase [Haloterrigena gelatinilytica]